MKTKKKLRCARCGSSKVHIRAWINANTYKFSGFTDDEDVWCDKCDEFTEFEETNTNDSCDCPNSYI